MLSHIHIRNYTIIEQLDLELSPGMTAMTGETGAGKSILVDALGLALGDRADSGVIRLGADNAEIIISFDLSDTKAATVWLEEQDLQADQECIIRRTLSREGQSKGFINGRPVPMRSLKDLGEMLVDIQGQHQHQSLVKRDIQRQLLDDYAQNQILLKEIKKQYRQWQSKSDEYNRLKAAAEDSAARIELLRFQVKELEQLEVKENEIQSLNQEHDRLANAGQILDSCQNSIHVLYEAEDSNIHQLLNRVSFDLGPLCEIDDELKNAYQLVNDAIINSQEAADELRSYLDRLDIDPQRLQYISDRMTLIHDMARKHKVKPEELPKLFLRLSDEFDKLDNSDDKLDQLYDEIQTLEKQYDEQAIQLRSVRQKAAKKLNKKVTDFIHQLGMPNALFEITLKPYEKNKRTSHGIESIEYKVCTNPGQDLSPLSKVASGGELSRISLAIQVVLAQTTRINTLVYDEVDTGIGGPTAEVVGQLLRTLGKTRQVLCVTHLPQVAAQAHNHLQVKKQADKKSTVTGIQSLNDKQRIEEIARMLGGVKITDQSKAHAIEMLDIKD